MDSTLKPSGPYSLLLAELPDLFQDLFLQINDRFTCFSSLPTEIRLSIWRFAFPRGRLMNIDELVMAWFIVMDADRRRTCGIEKSRVLPSTLYVNQESRQETFKHYIIVSRPVGRLAGVKIKVQERPLCFNPKLDTMFFTDNYIMNDPKWEWLHEIQEEFPALFDSIEEVQIRNCNRGLSGVWELGCSVNSGVLSHELAFFVQFPGLKTVNIVLSELATDGIGPFQIQIDQYEKDLGQAMVALFQKHAPQRLVAPKVTVAPWNKLLSRVL
ncbi:hypothetical protein ONS95_004680 [Cadophora gregata]|uniref:uncharacterized protein n=1 Tax=Cadophora gregata TaxID=51156 RepID=UPI0026DD8071|nr:uncharacterized protein ONS95_004680 [Cadophora gregata]KAK0104386.1 hypothetical protein ONS95_004680 [Cadophora gregata]